MARVWEIWGHMHIAEHLWQMSLLAGLLIVFVLILRLLLRGCSKGYSYGLWLLVLLRLLCPIFIESDYSMQPRFLTGEAADTAQRGQPATPQVPVGKAVLSGSQDSPFPGENAGEVTSPGQTGMSGNGTEQGYSVPEIPDPPSAGEGWNSIRTEGVTASSLERVWQNSLPWLKGIHGTGTGMLLLWFTVQYAGWKRKLKAAVHIRDNIWCSEKVSSPFVLGVLRTRIYLPYELEPETERYILLHERSHIRHGDPLLRLLGTFALCLHWWNPLVWLGIHLFYQDMEMFCDETAMARADLNERRTYAATLLRFALKQSGPAAVLSFGETHTGRRIRNILQNKRNGRGITFCVALAALVGGIFFLTVPHRTQAGIQPESKTLQAPEDGEQSVRQPTVSPLPQQQEKLLDYILSEGQTDMSTGGRVTLRLVLTEGTRNVYRGQDNEETVEYEGTYELQMLNAQGQMLDRRALANEQGGREMRFFYKDFPWHTQDYNLDGQQDFFLGTKTADGRSYHYFFTVTAEGKLEYLYDGPMWGDYWTMSAEDITDLSLQGEGPDYHQLFLYQMNGEYSSHDFYTWDPYLGKYRKSVDFTGVYPEGWDQEVADYLEGDWRVSGIDIWTQEESRPDYRIGEILRYADGVFRSLDATGNVAYEGNIQGCSSLTQSGEEFWNTFNVAWLDAYAQDARRILVNLGENAYFGNAIYILDENTMLVYDLASDGEFWTATRVRQRGEAAHVQAYLQGTWEITGVASAPYQALEQAEAEAFLGTKLTYDWRNTAHEYAIAGAWETSLPIRGFGRSEDDSANWPDEAKLPVGNFQWWNVNLGEGEFFGNQMIRIDENTMWVYYVGTFFEARREE